MPQLNIIMQKYPSIEAKFETVFLVQGLLKNCWQTGSDCSADVKIAYINAITEHY